MSRSKTADPLAAIRKSLTDADLQSAQSELEAVFASSQDAGSACAAKLSSLLSSLLEMVSCFDDSEDDLERTTEVVAFVTESLDTLNDTLEDKSGATDRARETSELARQLWGEYLDLLPQSEATSAWSDWSDTEGESRDDDFDTSNIDMGALLAGLSGAAAETVEEKTKPAKKAKPATKKKAPARRKPAAKAAAPSIPDPPAPEQPEMEAEIVEAYMDDATGCLASMENCLLTMESDPSNTDTMRQFCRELHTLKGASGSVGLNNLAGYLHQLEDYVEATHKAGGTLDIDPVLQGVDAVREQLTLLTGGSLAGSGTGSRTDEPRASSSTIDPCRTIKTSAAAGSRNKFRSRRSQSTWQATRPARGTRESAKPS